MKIGDRVNTPRGPGVYIGISYGGVRIYLDDKGERRFRKRNVTVIAPPSQVDAVVGEQCVAILERLRDALGVGSIGEVEGAVMKLLQKDAKRVPDFADAECG